jgi:hypothetical protein
MINDLENPPWYSSYEKNNYGDFFYSLIRIYQPEKVVELGTKAGYSAYHMARGLKANGRGSLDCYDLWEKYQFKSVPKSVAEENLKKFKDIISFKLVDAVGVDKAYKTVDILHVDVSNEGGILEKIIPHWIDKTRQLIIIEGGSSERDKVEWMIKFKKIPIKKWLEEFSRHRGNIEYLTIEPFTSVTIIRKI